MIGVTMVSEEEPQPQESKPLTDDETMMLLYYFEYATAYIRQTAALTGKLDPSMVKMLS